MRRVRAGIATVLVPFPPRPPRAENPPTLFSLLVLPRSHSFSARYIPFSLFVLPARSPLPAFGFSTPLSAALRHDESRFDTRGRPARLSCETAPSFCVLLRAWKWRLASPFQVYRARVAQRLSLGTPWDGQRRFRLVRCAWGTFYSCDKDDGYLGYLGEILARTLWCYCNAFVGFLSVAICGADSERAGIG